MRERVTSESKEKVKDWNEMVDGLYEEERRSSSREKGFGLIYKLGQRGQLGI
jgi:hypothetical protein